MKHNVSYYDFDFSNREEISSNILQDVKILVIPGPQNVFTDDELSVLKTMVERGDSVLVMMTDGGEERMNTNINFFLEEYGIVVNNGNKVNKLLNLLKLTFYNKELVTCDL